MDVHAASPVEIISSILLALAAVASAWCAYQSALWNGEQLERLGEASNSQFESTRKLSVVNRNFTIDVAMFMNYVIADLHGDAKVAQFLRSNVRPELAPAMEAWIQDVAAGKPDPPNPFIRPQYHPLGNDSATQMADDAAGKLAAGRAAIVNSSLFMLHTVIIAMALFFLGETNVVHRVPMKLALLFLGGAALVVTVLSVRRVPRLKPPPRPPRAKSPGGAHQG